MNKMSKPITPSRRLLSTFSQYLRFENIHPRQCRQLSTKVQTFNTSSSLRTRSTPCHSTNPNAISRRTYKTVQEQRSRYKSGPFSWGAGLLFLSSGAALIFYFRYEKERMERKRVAEATKGMGRPKVGGEFELVDQKGRAFGSGDMKGKYALVSDVFLLRGN